MRLLNLGCGGRYREGWTNIDFLPCGPGVIAHDLRKGIPFPDDTFDLVYHSHVLEHFTRTDGAGFLKECHRVLKENGVLRVVVPDLEQIASLYLKALGEAAAGSEEWAAHYDWMLLEMYDQTVRNRSGGEMAAYLQQDTVPNADFVVQRIGMEAEGLMARRRQQVSSRVRFVRGWRERLLKVLLGDEYAALVLGRFRTGGEVHLWMYDRYSLAAHLQACGFQHVCRQEAHTSHVPAWRDFNLDSDPNGKVYKPDSLFMEAIKP